MLWGSCWSDPWKTNRPYRLIWHPREGRTFTGAYPIRYICFVRIALMHGELLQFIGYQSLWKWWNVLWVHEQCMVSFILVQVNVKKKRKKKYKIIVRQWSHDLPFFPHVSRLSSWVVIRSLLSACFSQITPLRRATTTWHYTVLLACHLEDVGNSSGRLGVRGWGGYLLVVHTPCIVIEVVKCLGRANHWRDPEKRRVPRWPAAAVVSKKVLGIQ